MKEQIQNNQPRQQAGEHSEAIDLSERSAQFLAWLDDLHFGMLVFDFKGEIIDLNQMACEILGSTREYLLGKTPHEFDVFDEEGVLLPREGRLVPRVIAARKPIHDEVISWKRLDTGEQRWLLTHLHPLLNAAGEIERIFCTATEISALVKTQRALRKREEASHDFQEHLKTLHELSLILSQVDSPDELCRRAVELGRQRFGFDRLSLWLIADDPEQLEGTYGTDETGSTRAEHSQTMRSTVSSRQEMFDNGDVWVQSDWPHLDAQGNEVGRGWHMMVPLKDRTAVIGVLNADNYLHHRPLREYEVELLGLYGGAIGHRYTRLRTEMALRESEERLRIAVTGSNDGLFDVNLATDKIYFSPRFLELLGFAEHPLELTAHLSALEARLHPEDAVLAAEHFQESLSRGVPFHAEYRLRCRSGEYRWFEVRGDVLCDESGQPTRLAGFLTDITVSKRQILLMEQTNRTAHVGGWEHNVGDEAFYWTAETYRIHEISPEVHVPSVESSLAFYTPDSVQQLQEAITRSLSAGEGFDLELELITAEQRRIVVRTICNVLMEAGMPIKLFGAIQDITSNKQAEIARWESEALFRTLFMEAAVGIALTDAEGHLIMSNPALEEMLGYGKDELLGMALTEFTYPEDIALSMKLHDELFAGRRNSFQMEKRYIRKDGRVIWSRLTASVVRDAEGAWLFGIGMVENITERKQTEQSLNDSLARLQTLTSHLHTVREEERSRVAREVHDELGQALTGLKIDLAWLRRHSPQGGAPVPAEALMDKMDTMNTLIESTINAVRRIATELRPAILDTFGLVPALEWQAQDFGERTGIPCIFTSNMETVPLDQERMTAVFRIAQESLTNVVRHAKAKRVHMRFESDKEMLVLTVRDDGIGIGTMSARGSKSFGMLSMHERALLLGGEVQIVAGAKKGTIVKLRIPMR